MSQLTLGQPLGNSYKNAALGNANNRGSMFISPTTDIFFNNNNSSSNFGQNSVVDLNLAYNSSSASLLDPGSQMSSPELDSEPRSKTQRPPSQYLEDLLDDKSFL